MTVVGLDIGGANIKAATAAGDAISVPFPLWKHPERLAMQLAECLCRWPQVQHIAATMTGELADCFATKAEGVATIVGAVREACPGCRVEFWSTNGRFLTPDEATCCTRDVAAANWHALATWAGKLAPVGSALLIDIGTTTTDIIPLRDGRPIAVGRTDLERLQTGELVYSGVRRTPLMALGDSVVVGGRTTSVAAELFATTLDVYLWLRDIDEEVGDTDTANGRPATRSCAGDRLCRMVCADVTELAESDMTALAQTWAQRHAKQIRQAVARVLDRMDAGCRAVIVSGSGEFLARRVARTCDQLRDAGLFSLSAAWSPAVAEAACAYAVANLATAGV